MYGTPLIKKESHIYSDKRSYGHNNDIFNKELNFYDSLDSIGSKEGWAPSQFRSTRADKAQRTQRNVQDYMDQKDLDDYEKSIILAPVYAAKITNDKVGLLDRLLQPSGAARDFYKDGYKIMENMGWKEGQGIGPKITKKMKITDFDIRQFEVAPLEDYGSVKNRASSDHNTTKFSRNLYRGLGYDMTLISDDSNAISPTVFTQVISSDKTQIASAKSSKKRKLPMISVYEEENEDEDDFLVIKKKTLPKLASKPKFVSSFKTNTVSRKCSDGSAPLKDFVVSFHVLFVPTKYESINVNADFVPKFLKDNNCEDSTKSTLNFEKLTPNTLIDKDNIGNKKEEQDNEFLASNLLQVFSISRETALAALSHSTSPYPSDPLKNSRYRFYLECQAGSREEDTKFINNGELAEFQRVAMIFRPSRGAISARFTSATGNFEEVPIVKGTTRSMAEEAAEQGNYGPLTFSITDWTPERLLCKRFNVKFIGVSDGDISTSKDTTIPSEILANKAQLQHMSSSLSGTQAATTVKHSNVKASKDLFTEVFGQDSEEDEELSFETS